MRLVSLLALPLPSPPSRSPPRPSAPPTSERSEQTAGLRLITTMTTKSSSPASAGGPATCLAEFRCSTARSSRRELRPSIGETLARQPGVTASSFGPTASRPILRGLSGDRIRVLTDGIGSFDVSASSPDHAVAINPLTAERIEVLRGPAALLYGSSAIGGVVNVIDRRIPRSEPEGSARCRRPARIWHRRR